MSPPLSATPSEITLAHPNPDDSPNPPKHHKHKDFSPYSSSPSSTLDLRISEDEEGQQSSFPGEKPHSALDLDALKRIPTDLGALRRVTTVELAGQMYRTREGRGEAAGEPLRHAITNEDITYIDWTEGDPENPFNWKSSKKWAFTYIVVSISILTSMNATAYPSGYKSAGPIIGVGKEGWTVGNSVYMVVVAFAPLVLAPLSEVYGRNLIYLVTTFLSAALFIPQAASPTMAGITASRAFQGAASSVGNSLVGGTIADMFVAEERGLGMSIYSLFIFLGQAIGPAIYAWVCQILGYRWMFWIEAITGFASFAVNYFFLEETRGSLLLSRRAVQLTKATGKLHAAPGDSERVDLKTLVRVSVARPILYLCTEPIVFAISLWIGVVWGCIFLFINSVSIVFGKTYGFDTGLTGTVLLTNGIGGIIGFGLNLFQERLYKRRCAKSPTGKAEPESRLVWACGGAFAFPLGIFWYAWTGQEGIHWIWPVLALVFVNSACFLIYTGVFSFFADAYERYSSSAQAAQSLLRNLFGAVFPLFSTQMYTSLGPSYASTILACVTFVLGLCPVGLMFYGKRLRSRSKVASALLAEAAAEDEERARIREDTRRKERTRALALGGAVIGEDRERVEV